MFFTAQVWEWLVSQTNLYANQKRGAAEKSVWYPVSVEEMKGWVAKYPFLFSVMLTTCFSQRAGNITPGVVVWQCHCLYRPPFKPAELNWTSWSKYHKHIQYMYMYISEGLFNAVQLSQTDEG